MRSLALGVIEIHLLLAVLAAPVFAASGPAIEPESPWEVSITPYIWAFSVDGTMGMNGVETDMSASFGDFISDLNWGGFLKGEVRYKRALFVFDTMFAHLGSDTESGPETVSYPGTTVTRGFSATRRRTVEKGPLTYEIGPASLKGDFRLDIPGFDVVIGPVDVQNDAQLVMVDLLAGYRALDTPIAGLMGGTPADEDRRRFTVDLFGGARYWNMKGWVTLKFPDVAVPSFEVTPSGSVGVSAGGGPAPGPIPVEVPELRADKSLDFPGLTIPENTLISGGSTRFKMDEWWIDPVIGVRVAGDISEKWYLGVVADVGGFGIGSASHLTWQAMAFAGWRFGTHWSLQVGWRALSIDRSQGTTSLDMLTNGPLLGFTYRF